MKTEIANKDNSEDALASREDVVGFDKVDLARDGKKHGQNVRQRDRPDSSWVLEDQTSLKEVLAHGMTDT